MRYLLSANEKHREISYANLLHCRCSSLGICHPVPAKSSCGLLRLTTRMPVCGGMISHVLSGIWSWHGRRQNGLQINYFIPGAWSLCQERNVLHSFPRGCWKCGIAVRLLLLLLCRALSAQIPNVKLTGIQLADCSRRIRQEEPVISLHSLKSSRIR